MASNWNSRAVAALNHQHHSDGDGFQFKDSTLRPLGSSHVD
ncbi:MAG: hypothetical protein ACON4T_05640 [Synechococcus sp.]